MAPDLPSKTLTLGGQPMTVFGSSAEDHYFNSVADELDPEFTRFAGNNVGPDAVCVDLGANIGVKTVQLARLAPRGRVLAVEAGPQLHAALGRTVAANGLGNVATEHAAVTDHDGGTVRFEENSAYGHISPEGAPEGVEVPAVTLAGLVARHGLGRLDFLKMDLEGFEFPVLRSSVDLLARHGTVVCFEFNPWCLLAFTDDHPRLCLEWLLGTFTEVYALRRANPPETQLARADRGVARALLAHTFFEDGFVTDLVACMAPGRVRG